MEERFVTEKERTYTLLTKNTWEPARKILETTFLTPNLNTIVTMPNTGIDFMIDSDKNDDLSRMYTLFCMVPEGLPTLRRGLKDSIAWRGKEVNSDMQEEEVENDPSGKGKGKARAQPVVQPVVLAIKWVEDTLSLKDKFDELLKGPFRNDKTVQTAMNEVCLHNYLDYFHV